MPFRREHMCKPERVPIPPEGTSHMQTKDSTAPAGGSELRRRMLEDMALRGFTEKTQSSYVRAVEGLSRYHGRAPDSLSDEDIRRYFVHLKCERKLASPADRFPSPRSPPAPVRGRPFRAARPLPRSPLPRRTPRPHGRPAHVDAPAALSPARPLPRHRRRSGHRRRLASGRPEVPRPRARPLGDLPHHDDREVVFRYRDSQTGQSRTARLEPMEFLRRFLQHVLPSGFRKVRHFGLHHSSKRKALRLLQAQLALARRLPLPPADPPVRPPLPPRCCRWRCSTRRPRRPAARWCGHWWS